MAPVDVRNRIEQIRRSKNKKKDTQDGKDLRQLLLKKNKSKKSNDNSPNRTARGRITKQQQRDDKSGGSRDLRDTHKKLSLRKDVSTQSGGRRMSSSRNEGPSTQQRSAQSSQRKAQVVDRRTMSNEQSVRIGKKVVQQQQYYVPPHMQRNQPTYIIAPNVPTMKPVKQEIHHAPETQGASVLISNLPPSITQSDIIELFGDIGIMTAVNMINTTTALVTYQNSSDAVRAVKMYHNRLLDGRPMQVNMMPSSV